MRNSELYSQVGVKGIWAGEAGTLEVGDSSRQVDTGTQAGPMCFHLSTKVRFLFPCPHLRIDRHPRLQLAGRGVCDKKAEFPVGAFGLVQEELTSIWLSNTVKCLWGAEPGLMRGSEARLATQMCLLLPCHG